jgi:hypothetical protein
MIQAFSKGEFVYSLIFVSKTGTIFLQNLHLGRFRGYKKRCGTYAASLEFIVVE